MATDEHRVQPAPVRLLWADSITRAVRWCGTDVPVRRLPSRTTVVMLVALMIGALIWLASTGTSQPAGVLARSGAQPLGMHTYGSRSPSSLADRRTIESISSTARPASRQ